ncbi:LysR family transcriptional regulator [Rahnella sp. BIGb0236]|uniref:LysR family transcriptional regulator n=1 Tax=Rahnella sp. BIGb0236 TaxID=2485117 RepID=UPI00105F3218|nr:LysR family transcriptional regulator [Rahnella sp. BIGb0236]TDS98265.1 LysR family transcriptional regulator [Rahnella sp. BIGb0236]
MLENLKLFLMIVEKGTLSAAGRELGLSPASVSERLMMLESYYETRFLARTTRSLSLTEEGRIFAIGARRLLAEADELESRIKSGTQKISGPIKITAPVDLGQTRVVPILDRFLARHPDVTLDLNLTDSFVDLVSQGVDFAIRYGTFSNTTLKARPIGVNRRLICGSPDYLSRKGIPLHPDDLLNHECIMMRFTQGIERTWSFQNHGAPYAVSVNGQRTTNNGQLIKQWALQGHGLCKKSIWDVEDDLACGRLVEVLAAYAPSPTALHIVYSPAPVQPRRVTKLIDVIANELAIYNANG